MKLVTRFSISATMLVLVVIMAVVVVLYIYQRQILIEQIEQKNKSLIKGMSEVTKESMFLHDDLLLLNFLKQIKENRGVAYAMVIDLEGEIIAHNDTQYLGKVIDDTAGLRAKKSETLLKQSYISKQGQIIYELCEPIYLGNTKKGIVRIGLFQETTNQIIRENLVGIGRKIFNITVVALILGIVGSIILAVRMSKPIKVIAQGAKLIGEGKLDYRMDIRTRDELGWLAQEFNTMAMKLQELDQLKDDFVSSVTHELRSPLTAITGYVDYLLEENKSFSSDEREYLEIIKKNAVRLSKFVNNILDIAKIESGQVEIQFTELSVQLVVEEIVTLFKPVAEQKKVALQMIHKSEIPSVYTNRDRLFQVLTNLISNSLKFTPQGGKITVGIKKSIDSNFVDISVADTGIGIPRDGLNRVFDRFYQVRGVREKITGAKGAGLGLAIVKGIIDALGGKIWVDSEVNKGTTFYFSIPMYQQEKV